MYTKEKILNEVNQIRKEIGHEPTKIHIHEIHYDENENEIWIIAEDRPDKSAIIGKGGWVVGKLREKLQINKVHVESYGDFLLKRYKLELSQRTINNFNCQKEGFENLKTILNEKLDNIYSFDFNSYLKNNEFQSAKTHDAVVALSGGVDSSFSLIVAEKLGSNSRYGRSRYYHPSKSI